MDYSINKIIPLYRKLYMKFISWSKLIDNGSRAFKAAIKKTPHTEIIKGKVSDTCIRRVIARYKKIADTQLKQGFNPYREYENLWGTMLEEIKKDEEYFMKEDSKNIDEVGKYFARIANECHLNQGRTMMDGGSSIRIAMQSALGITKPGAEISKEQAQEIVEYYKKKQKEKEGSKKNHYLKYRIELWERFIAMCFVNDGKELLQDEPAVENIPAAECDSEETLVANDTEDHVHGDTAVVAGYDGSSEKIVPAWNYTVVNGGDGAEDEDSGDRLVEWGQSNKAEYSSLLDVIPQIGRPSAERVEKEIQRDNTKRYREALLNIIEDAYYAVEPSETERDRLMESMGVSLEDTEKEQLKNRVKELEAELAREKSKIDSVLQALGK